MVLFVHLFNLNYECPKLLETSEPRPKQNRHPEPREHTKDPPLAILVFFNFRQWDFFRKFFDYIKGSPSYIFFDILQQNGC